MPTLPYRPLKDLYDSLHDSGIVTQDLPSWAQGMNTLTESDAYSEGLHDNWIKRTSVGVDRLLEQTPLPEWGAEAGGALGSLFGAEAQGRDIGASWPRMAVDFAPSILAGPLGWGARGLLATGALSGANTYTQTGSPAAGVTSGLFNALLPGVVGAVEKGLLGGMGVKATEGAFGDLFNASIRANASPLQRAAAWTGGQGAAFGLMGGQEILSEALDPNREVQNPFTKEFALSNLLGQAPFFALHGATSLTRPSGAKYKATVDEAIATVRAEQQRIKLAEEARVTAERRIAPLDPSALDASTNAIIERALNPEARKFNVKTMEEYLDLQRPDAVEGPEQRLARLAQIDELFKDVDVADILPSKEAPVSTMEVEGKVTGTNKKGTYAVVEVADTPENVAAGFKPGEKIGFPTTLLPDAYEVGKTGKIVVPKRSEYVARDVQDSPAFRMREEAKRLAEAARVAEDKKQQGLTLSPQTEPEVLRARANEAAFLARQATAAKWKPEIDKWEKAMAAASPVDMATKAHIATQLNIARDEAGLAPLSREQLTSFGLSYGPDGVFRALNATRRQLEALESRETPEVKFEETTPVPVTQPKGDATVQTMRRAFVGTKVIESPMLERVFETWKKTHPKNDWSDEKLRLHIYNNLAEEAGWTLGARLTKEQGELLQERLTDAGVEVTDELVENFPVRPQVVAMVNAMNEARNVARVSSPAKPYNSGQKFSSKLEEEIAYKLDIDREPEDDPYTRKDALRDLMQDMDDKDSVASEFKKELEDFGASIGVFKPFTKAQVDSIVSTSNRKKYDFKRGETYYIFDSWKPLEGLSSPARPQRLSAGGPFTWSFVNYDETANKLGKHTLPRNGVIRESQFKNMAGGEGVLPDVELALGREFVPEAFDGAGNVNVPVLMKGLKEKGPVVEVKKLGDKSPQSARKVTLIHQLDTEYPGWQERSEANTPRDDREAQLWRQMDALAEYQDESPNAAKYSFLGPKSQSEMPGYVEGLVRVPYDKNAVAEWIVRDERYNTIGRYTTEEAAQTAASRNKNYEVAPKYKPGNIRYTGPHFGAEDTNVLAFFRGYEETLPNGTKAFHVIEVQSDWGQTNREWYKNNLPQGMERSRLTAPHAPDHPLLSVYEPLALKAAIDHAVSVGAKKIILSDAETAMMTEGHDKAARGWGVEYKDGTNNSFVSEQAAREEAAKVGGKVVVPEVSQEKGMRLHYDTTLPSALAKLTGEKGERMEVGTHKNATEELGNLDNEERDVVRDQLLNDVITQQQHDRALSKRQLVGSPVFRDASGVPKSFITGLAFDLTKAKATLETNGGFTLSRPSYVRPIADAEGSLSPMKRVMIDEYKLKSDGLTMAKTLVDVAMEPGIRATMKFLAERSPDMLQRTRGLFTENGYTHQLARLAEHTGDVVMSGNSLESRANLEYHLAHELTHAATVAGLHDPKMAEVKSSLEAIRQKMIAKLNPELRQILLDAERTGSVTKDIEAGGSGEFRFKDGKTLDEKLGKEKGETAKEYLYSLLNINEFVAEGMLPTQLRAQLQGTEKKANLFTKFVTGVKKLLGLAPEPSIHDEFLFHTNQIMEHANTQAKSFDYLETHFQDRGKTWDVANAFARDAVDFMNFHGTESGEADSLLGHLSTMPTATMSPEFQQAQRGVRAIVGRKGESFERLSTVLGEPASTSALDAWLESRLAEGGPVDDLQFMPTQAHDYVTEKARNMRDVAKALAAISHPDNEGVVNLMKPSVLRASAKEMVERLNQVIALERERAEATTTMQGLVDMLPDAAIQRMGEVSNPARPRKPTKLEEQVDDPKGITTHWFNTANQLARTSPLFREWLTGLLGHETQGRHAAVESNKIFGHVIDVDGKVSEEFSTKVGNDRMKWLSKGGGKGVAGPNAKVVDALIDLNNREGKDKAQVLPAQHVEVKKMLARLSPDDQAKALEFVALISHGNKTSQQATLEFMTKEAAQYGAQAVMLGSKEKPVDAQTAIRLSDTVVRAFLDAKKDPSKAQVLQGLLGGVQQQMSPEAFQNLVRLADNRATAISGVETHFENNPGWVSAKRYRKNLFNFRENGELKTESANDMAEAQRIAGNAKVLNFRPNVPGEFVEYGPRNKALAEEMARSDEFVYDMMQKLGASDESLAFLRQNGTGTQWLRAHQTNYDVGAPAPRTGRTLGRTASTFPWTENYFHWTDANAGYWSRRLTRTLADTLLSAPEYKADPALVKAIQQHATGFLSPDPELAKKVTKATALWNLGFQVASPIVNLGQPFFRGIPELMRIPGVSWMQATKHIVGAIKDFARHKFTNKSDWTNVLSQEEQEFMAGLRHDGVIDKSTFDEHFAQQSAYGQNMINAYQGKLLVKGLGQTLSTPTGALANVAMGLFKQTEVANNSVVPLAAYRAIRQLQPEKGIAYAAQQARDINAAVNDTGGRINRPIAPFSEPGKVPRSIAMLATSMQSYNLGSLNQLIRHYKDAWRNTSLTPSEKYAARNAFFAQLGMQFAAAGLLGMPFAGSMLALVNAAAPDLEVNKKARELVNSFLAGDAEAGNAWTDMAMTGVPSMFGWDLQSRLSSGNILPGVSEWNGFQPEAMLGVPVTNMLSFAKGAKQVVQGDAHGALAFVPPAFRKMTELIQENGKVLDYKNRPVIDDLTVGEKAGLVIGFNPKRLTDFNAAQRMAKQSEEVDARRKAGFREQMAEEALKGNFGTIRGKLTDMAKADPNFNPVTEVRSIAQYAENQAFPRDLRRESSGNARAKLLAVWNLPASSPTEQARLAFRQKVEQSLGVQPTQGRATALASAMDSLRLQHPSMTTSELRRLADAAVSRHLRQTLQEPQE